jgi:transglutaminase-like putative cysteine protease
VNAFTPYGWPEPGAAYLESTWFLDHDHPAVGAFAREAVAGASGAREQAVRLFYAVRDRIRYDPYAIRLEPETFRASKVLADGRAFCVPKAVLLAAAARHVGIPSGVGLSDVVNHFTSPKLQRMMGGRDVFIHHGWAALYIDGRWVKAAPAFNRELCLRIRVPPTEFDGVEHGMWSDLPYQRIDDDFRGFYPATTWLPEEDGSEFAEEAQSDPS